jgi:hypothetical protein
MHTKWLACDPAYGSSKLGITVVQWRDQKLEVLYADEYERMLFSDSVKLLRELIHKYNPCKVFLDSSNVSLVAELRHGSGETVRYDKLPPETVRSWFGSGCNSPTIVPVAFNQLGQPMLKNCMRVFPFPQPIFVITYRVYLIVIHPQ